MCKKEEMIKEEVLNWYVNVEDRGLSSETLAQTAVKGKVTGKGGWGPYAPSDNSDFNRCIIFKEKCPNAFLAAKEILIESGNKIWIGYFDNWDKMEKLLKDQKEKKNDGSELFAIMKNIQKK